LKERMAMLKFTLYLSIWAAVFLVGSSQPAQAELRWGDLNTERPILEADWLRLKLEVMALRLSYPAYRVEIMLSDEPRIEFSFVASGGMAKHLTEEVARGEAEEVLAYHAGGIRDQIEKLLKEEFQSLWEGFDGKVDISGHFLGPGTEWSDPPRLIGNWHEDTFTWSP
jgi:hypothetical protein